MVCASLLLYLCPRFVRKKALEKDAFLQIYPENQESVNINKANTTVPDQVKRKLNIMRVRTYVLIALVGLLFMSSGSKESILTEGINPGDIAPRIESLENGRVVDFRNQEGRYTLVNFWAAYDAESRARNVRLMHAINCLDSNQVEAYSISLDTKRSIFHETLKCDRLDGAAHFLVEADKQVTLRKAYRLDRGFNSYLINDKGVIVASDVTPEKLAEVLRKI